MLRTFEKNYLFKFCNICFFSILNLTKTPQYNFCVYHDFAVLYVK